MLVIVFRWISLSFHPSLETHIASLYPSFSRIKWEKPSRMANKSHRGAARLRHQAKGMSQFTVRCSALFQCRPRALAQSLNFVLLSPCRPLQVFSLVQFPFVGLIPWGSRDLIMMAFYRRLTSFFTKGFQWIIYRRPLSLFTRAEIPLRNNSEKRKMRHIQALSSRFLTTKLWQWILLRGVISLQAIILRH